MACLSSVVNVVIYILMFFTANGQNVGSDMAKKVQNADMEITNLKSKILELERARASLEDQFRQSETRRVLYTNQTGVLEQDENSDVVTKLRNTNMDIIDLKSDLLALEQDRISLLTQHRKLVANHSVVSDYIKTEVETTLDSILTNRQVQDMMRELVREKLNALIKNFKNLRRTVHVMSRRLRDFEGCCNSQNKTYLDMTNKLHHFDHVTSRLEKEVSDCQQLPVDGFNNVTSNKKTLEEDVDKIKEELTSMNQSLQTRLEMCQSKNTSNYEATTLTPVNSLPPPRNMDLLTAPFTTEGVYLQRLDLHTQTLTNFPLRLVKVRSLLYVPSKRSVFFTTNDTKGIFSFDVDSKKQKQIRKTPNVLDMALDENRQTVFMGYLGLGIRIGTMDTDGSSFRSLVNLTKYGIPCRLAVNPNRKMVYVCMRIGVLQVDYTGQTVETLYMGNVFAITLDLAKDLVYFSNERRIIRKSLSTDETATLIEVDFIISDLVFYNSSVYIASVSGRYMDIIHIGEKGENIVHKKLQTVERTLVSICLIPKSQSKTEPSYEATTVTPVPPPRNMDLLTVPYTAEGVYLQRLDLHTQTLTNFSLRLVKVRSLLYVPSKRSVFFSTRNAKGIFSFNVDSKKQKQIRKKLTVLGMALDENCQTVFMAHEGRWRGIRTMDTAGRSFRSLVYLAKYGSPRRLAVDPNRKMVYVCTRAGLLQVDYAGQTVETLYMGKVFAVTLDLIGDLVYFSIESRIIRKSLSTDEKAKLFEVDFIVNDLVFYNNSVYIGSMLDGNVDVIHIGNKGENIVYNRLQTGTDTSVSICLIPRSQSKNVPSYEATTVTPVTSLPLSRNMDLLTAPYFLAEEPIFFQRINLQNQKRTNFPLRLMFVGAILYVPLKRSVFFSTLNPERISSINIDSEKVKHFLTGLAITGMALDENLQTVFIISANRGEKEILTMDTDGNLLETVVSLEEFSTFRKVAVDPKRKIVYLCTSTSLLQIPYDGRAKEIMYRSETNNIMAVTFDLVGDAVYFSSGYKLIRNSFSNEQNKNTKFLFLSLITDFCVTNI